jgi:bla regulator protein BlaR1
MHSLTFGSIVFGETARAICRTLVHSLWIGLVLTIITGAIVLFTKKQSALLRYNLLTGAFMLFIISIIAVFIMQLWGVNYNADANIAIALPAAAPHINAAATDAFLMGESESILSGITSFFDNYANIIVLTWCFMIVFRSIKFAGGLRKINQLKTDQLFPAGDQWNEKLKTLCEQLRISSTVKFFQSGIATIPMVAGHFKPVILFPIGLLNSLSQEETEAILLHELAHIRRKDFLINMIQHVAEILFFFNPAVLWVSSLIKIERENCCDDIVLQNTGSKRNYINALISFQEYHLSGAQYVPALAGKKEHLLQRVKRMLYNNPRTLNGGEKISLTICLIVIASMTILFSNAGTGTQKNAAVNAPAQIADSVVSIADRYYDPAAFKEGSNAVYTENINGVTHVLRIFKRNGKLYEIYGDITSFKINGKKIPQAQWGKYNKLMGQLMADNSSTKSTAEESPEKQEAVEAAENAQSEKQAADVAKAAADEDRKAAEAKKMEQIITSTTTTRSQTDHQEPQSSYRREQEWRVNDNSNVNDNVVARLSYSAENHANVQVPVKAVSAATPVAPQKPKKPFIFTGLESDASGPERNMDIRAVTQNFINDLTAAKVISGTAGLSYKMSRESLIVNGVVQPGPLHKMLEEKYIQSPDWKLLYNWSE